VAFVTVSEFASADSWISSTSDYSMYILGVSVLGLRKGPNLRDLVDEIDRDYILEFTWFGQRNVAR
jgi:hypothetical protein